MKFRFSNGQENRYGAPPNIYRAKFLGVDERESEQYGPGLEWRFEIADGEFRGKIVTRTTGTEPTMKNACGRMISDLFGGSVELDAELDVGPLVGRHFQVKVEPNSTGTGTRVGTVMPAPGGTAPRPATRPAPAPPPRPPARPPAPAAAPAAPPVVRYWVQREGDVEPVLMTEHDLNAWLAEAKVPPAAVPAVKEGESEWGTLADYGFKDAIPF